MTSSGTRKTSINRIAVQVEEGVVFQDAIKDAIVAAVQTGVDTIVITHKGKEYTVHLPSILRLIASQVPLVTGKSPS